MTALEIITTAYNRIGEIPVGVTPSTEDLALGLSELNSICGNWEAAQVLGLGRSVFTFVSTGASNLNPTGTDEALIAHLAIRLAQSLHHPVTDDMKEVAVSSMRALLPKAII